MLPIKHFVQGFHVRAFYWAICTRPHRHAFARTDDWWPWALLNKWQEPSITDRQRLVKWLCMSITHSVLVNTAGTTTAACTPGRITDYVLGMSSTSLMDELHIYYTSLTVGTVCQRWSRMIKADKIPEGERFIVPTKNMESALKTCYTSLSDNNIHYYSL